MIQYEIFTKRKNMKKELVIELQEIIGKEYGKKLTFDESADLGEKLLDIFKIINNDYEKQQIHTQ